VRDNREEDKEEKKKVETKIAGRRKAR